LCVRSCAHPTAKRGDRRLIPELLLRILLLGYLYGITSERKLLEELRMHLAWRWFTELGFEQEIPHHSKFSKNRHGRFEESNLFQELFERTVEQCMAGCGSGGGRIPWRTRATTAVSPANKFTEAAQVNYGSRNVSA